MYNGQLNIMNTEKKCTRCQQVQTLDNFHSNPKMKSGLNSWCRKCGSEATRIAKAKKKGEEWALLGYNSEIEHFNEALKHYAEVFNCPNLLKHIKNDSK